MRGIFFHGITFESNFKTYLIVTQCKLNTGCFAHGGRSFITFDWRSDTCQVRRANNCGAFPRNCATDARRSELKRKKIVAQSGERCFAFYFITGRIYNVGGVAQQSSPMRSRADVVRIYIRWFRHRVQSPRIQSIDKYLWARYSGRSPSRATERARRLLHFITSMTSILSGGRAADFVLVAFKTSNNPDYLTSIDISRPDDNFFFFQSIKERRFNFFLFSLKKFYYLFVLRYVRILWNYIA